MTTAATISSRLTLDTSQYSKALDAAWVQAQRFGANMSGIGNKLKGWGSSIGSGINQLSSTLKSMGSQLTMGVTVPLALTAAGILALGTNAISAGAKFDTQMRNIQSISRQSDAEIKMLGNEFLRMSENINVTTDSATKLAEGFYFIQSSGFAGADGMEVLRVSTKAATAGLSDTQTASQAILATLNAYGLKAQDAAHVSDVLFKTVDLGVLTFGDLASQLGDVVNTAATTNVNIETVGAALAEMTRKGISASESVTALNQLLLQFISPSQKMKDAAEAYGLGPDFLSVATLRTKGLAGALREIDAADPDAMLAIFGDNVRALKGALSLSGKNASEFTDILAQMGNVAGRTDQAFATQTQSLEAYGKNIKNVIENIKISFTQKFAPGLTKLAGAVSHFLTFYTPQIGGLLGRLAEIWDKVVEKIKSAMTGENARKIFEFFNRLIDAIPQVWHNLQDMWGKVKPVLQNLFEMLFPKKADPTQQIAGITTFILALGALGPILSGISTILPMLGPMFLALSSGIQANGPVIANFFQGLVEQIPAFIGKLQEIGTVVGPALQKLFDAFMNMDPNTMLLIVEVLGGLAALAPLFMVLGTALNIVSGAWGLISTVLGTLVPWLVGTAIPAIGAFIAANIAWIGPILLVVGTVTLLYLAFKNNFLGIRDIVYNAMLAIGGFIGNILTKLNGLKSALSGFHPPQWLMNIGAAIGSSGIFHNLPGQQTVKPATRDIGGMGFAGETYRIGIGAQPEMFTPTSNGHFTPNAGSGGDTYNVTIFNPKKESTEDSVRRTLKSLSATGVVHK